jgi:hypothetical protein
MAAFWIQLFSCHFFLAGGGKKKNIYGGRELGYASHPSTGVWVSGCPGVWNNGPPMKPRTILCHGS